MIKLVNVSKKFNIGFKKDQGILARAVSFISGREAKKEIEVLKDISFEVQKGEVIGIVGKNGSGKSTLLRIIAGIYYADRGSVEKFGRADYLSGFGNGLNPRLTMEENIYLMGSILGLSQRDMKDVFWEIVNFSGLRDFVYTKVYQFSSGMLARLTFSTTIAFLEYLKPEILLLDEVFGTGSDADFEQKAIKKMSEFIKCGATVVLASHNLNIIEKYCGKVIYIGEGEIIKEGDPKSVISEYKNAFQS